MVKMLEVWCVNYKQNKYNLIYICIYLMFQYKLFNGFMHFNL